MRFYLGTHEPSWLFRLGVPLFVSARRLRRQKRWPRRAIVPWALDSGGFSEISDYGSWQTSADQYAREATAWDASIGNLDWAAVQDWMCEPIMLKKTGLTVREHQRRTIDSYFELKDLAPKMPWTPVLQGWTQADYLWCADEYFRRGVPLDRLPIVGLGSVCRRQDTDLAEDLIRRFEGSSIPIHGFGFKTLGLRRVADVITSADSMAWSKAARSRRDEGTMPDLGCTHASCVNCPAFAVWWRERVLWDTGDAD